MTNTILFVFLLVLILWGGSYLLDFTDRKRLVYGKKKVKTALLNFSKQRGFKLFRNLTLDLDGERIHFDNLVVGFFGLLAVNVLEPQGEYCGEESEDKWVYTDKDSNRDYIENPIKQNTDALSKLKKAIGKEAGIYKFSTDAVTVFGGKESKTQVYTKSQDKVCYAKNFNAFLKDERFTKDTGVDLDKLVSFITNKIA